MSASAEWNPYARCEISLTLLFSASRRPLLKAQLDRREHARLVFADRAGELDERFQPGAGRPREPRLEALGRLLLGDLVEVAQLAVEQERAVHRLVREHDFGELEQLPGGLFGGA